MKSKLCAHFGDIPRLETGKAPQYSVRDSLALQPLQTRKPQNLGSLPYQRCADLLLLPDSRLRPEVETEPTSGHPVGGTSCPLSKAGPSSDLRTTSEKRALAHRQPRRQRSDNFPSALLTPRLRQPHWGWALLSPDQDPLQPKRAGRLSQEAGKRVEREKASFAPQAPPDVGKANNEGNVVKQKAIRHGRRQLGCMVPAGRAPGAAREGGMGMARSRGIQGLGYLPGCKLWPFTAPREGSGKRGGAIEEKLGGFPFFLRAGKGRGWRCRSLTVVGPRVQQDL